MCTGSNEQSRLCPFHLNLAVKFLRFEFTLEFNFEGQRIVATIVATLLRVLVSRGDRGRGGST